MGNKILVVIKEPGCPARVDPMFDNTLESFQEAVGGYIESVTFATDVVIICNEEGRIKNLPENTSICGVDFVGTIVACGTKADDFASLKSALVPSVMRLLDGV